VTLPADYVAEHVDLGYASTTHRAQGITVDRAHVLAAPGMVRENLYVAMTRGRHDNHVYVALDDVDPTCDSLPHVQNVPDAHEALAAILVTSGVELSATETIAASQDEVASLKRLEPIRQTLIANAAGHRWEATFPEVGLTAEQCEQITTSPARGPLITALERGRTLGHPMPQVLAGLIAARPIDDFAPAHDVAAVLHHRVDEWLHTQVDEPTRVRVVPDAVGMPDDVVGLLRQVEELIAARTEALTDQAIDAEPEWLVALGPAPVEPGARSTWRTAIAVHVAHDDATSGSAAIRVPPPLPPRVPTPSTEWRVTR
jgi:hypothetical protein